MPKVLAGKAFLGGIAALAFCLALSACGAAPAAGPASTPSNSSSGALQPSALGAADCSTSEFADESVYAQVAISGTTCAVAASVAKGSDSGQGAAYAADGFTCHATKQGSGSPWASAWGGTYYTYSCADGSAEIAFNWGTDYTYGSGVVNPPSPLTSPTSGVLEPSPLHHAQCEYLTFPDGSYAAQIAVADATCSTADFVAKPADEAQGSEYQTNGFKCSATAEGPGSPWAAGWSGTYYAYNCIDGSEQVAFNWGADG